MRPKIIRKSPADLQVPPNLSNYEAERSGFSWDTVRRELAGLADGAVNIAFEAVDRHLGTSVRDRVAFRFISPGDRERSVTYAELACQPFRL